MNKSRILNDEMNNRFLRKRRDTEEESRRERRRGRSENRRRASDILSLEPNSRGNGKNREGGRNGRNGERRKKKEDREQGKKNIGREWKGGGGRGKTPQEGYLFSEGDLFALSGKNKDLFRITYEPEMALVSLYLRRKLRPEDYVRVRESYVEVEIWSRERTDNDCEELKKWTESSYKAKIRDSFRHLFDVKLFIIEPFSCSQISEDMCLLPEGVIRLQQWENEPPDPLLILPSYSKLCPDIQREISIKMDDIDQGITPELEFDDSEGGAILTSMALDREFRDSFLNFTISCKIKTHENAIMKFKNVYGTLIIKDVDDSPPMRLKNQKVMWKISDNLDHLDDKLMIIDADVEIPNDYTIKLLGNTFGLILVESQSEFIVNKEICAQETNMLPKPLSAKCTLLTPHITFDERYVKDYPRQVDFSLVFVDTSLQSSDITNEVQYDITLVLSDLIHPDPKFRFLSTMNPTKDYDDFALETNVTLPRPLHTYARITQMFHPATYDHYWSMLRSSITFSLAPKSQDYGVGVTSTFGIVYILDPELLDVVLEREGRIEIILLRGTNYSSSVFLELSGNVLSCDDKLPKPSFITVGEDLPISCATHPYQNICEESCGVGSLAVRCSWRHFNGTFKSTHFATCSPDLSTCPDGICDELEQMDKEICPQDCVEEHMTKGQYIDLNTRHSPPRGILKGFGVCTCNDYCQCFPADLEPTGIEKTPHHKREKIRNKGFESESCGAACQIGLSIGILLAVFILVIIFCRRRKDCGGKYKEGELGRSHYPSDYADEHSSSYGPPHGEAHAVALHSVHNIHHNSPRQNNFNNNNNNQDLMADLPLENVSIDRKWEFPRSQLVIEQTLGEGEFGKVMKGRANCIGGQPGFTVVAVKMLKNNSTAAELADLLSEYDLLKEVQHPNVIRLLGACTTKGGPIYLIIEYCKYGSLRSYLRRSRHFELESRVGSAPTEDSPGDYQITPKQLLSFAWQICKGMNYLGNMKLVHRDLAARNVLLAEGKICKISDFGLTRDIYEGDLYFKRSKGRVPVKWLATESLVDHIYTAKSDIWSFGVLLWELVNLGSSPYPGVAPERLYPLLQSGYRMEKPDNCSSELYQVMRNCWHDDPSRRPSFSELTQIFERMIEADVEYLELRSLIVTNRSYFEDSALTHETQNSTLASAQIKESSRISIAKESTRSDEETAADQTQLDQDSYLVARSGQPKNPLASQETSDQVLPALTHNPTHVKFSGTNLLAHNPAYSPSNGNSPTILQPVQPQLTYSSLANGPDEEEDIGIVVEEGQDGCRSEGDSDSGRATGDSGYITEEGRKSRGSRSTATPQSFGKPLSSARGSRGSYSPLTPHEMEDEQDTSGDLEERQELLTADVLASAVHLTPDSVSKGNRISPQHKADNDNGISSASCCLSSTSGYVDGAYCSQQKAQQRIRRSPVQV